jgi:hypothetical protein
MHYQNWTAPVLGKGSSVSIFFVFFYRSKVGFYDSLFGVDNIVRYEPEIVTELQDERFSRVAQFYKNFFIIQ